MSFCAAKLNPSLLRINDQAALSKARLPALRRELLLMGKLTCSSVRRSVTTKFPNGSAVAGWAKFFSPPTRERGAKPRPKSHPYAFPEMRGGWNDFYKKRTP